MALLEGRNLRKTYRLSRRNTLQALCGVDVSIEPGEIVAIMGPSGSGKSTLMHILGLLHSPDSNHGPRPELNFNGRDMVALGEGERTRIRAREMGFVFQDFNLVPTLTALENVMLACDYAGVGGHNARQAALEALGLVGLSERAGHRPAELSGGEQQRVAIGPSPREPALPGAGGRADRQPRLGPIRGGSGAAAQAQPRARSDIRPGHPRPRGGPGVRSNRPHARRHDSRRTIRRSGGRDSRDEVMAMKVLVVYGSRLGATRGIAERIAARLEASGLDTALQAAEQIAELPACDAFVIGSGIYGQHWMKEAAALVRRNRAALSRRPVWLFSSGPVGRWASGHDPIEPKEVAGLRVAVGARDHRVFAGALDRSSIDESNLSAIERFVTRKFIAEGDYRDWDRIDAWADGIARDLNRLRPS
jgi:ABC-type lipoprotein export system ATPase subunit/menaquinone-dependent protoporphyrinogen IX oxidase